ncbi:MAG: NAD-dependent epimerase/dehydratase family protein, partial [Bryobacteraceae bacterium]|nr:NAD-dependent epimerase/dehydratase family protein [Bryobacteraceae bacterium]
MPTALIAGATGLVGQALLTQLLHHERYDRVIALVRRTALPSHPKLTEQIVADFRELPTVAAADVYCAIGTTIRKAGSREAFREVDFAIPVALGRMTKRNGARQFLAVSSIGADAKSGNFYLKVKGEVETELRGLGFESLHLFRPSFLMGERPESRPGERIGILMAQALGWAMIGPLAKYHAI